MKPSHSLSVDGEVRFIANGVTPYLSSTLQLTKDEIEIGTWRTVLGIVPVHRQVRRLRVDDIVDATVASSFHPERLVAAAVLAAVALLSAAPATLMWISAVIAIALLPLSFAAVLRISTPGGEHIDAPICLLMIPRARVAATDLLEARCDWAAMPVGGRSP